MSEQFDQSPTGHELHLFGRCRLESTQDGRRLLYIPIDLFNNIRKEEGDRDKNDSIARFFQQAFHRRTRPLWTAEYEETYAIEIPRDAADEQIESFAALIEQEQI